MTEPDSPATYASIGDLITPVEGAETRDVTLPGGSVVKVRGLTRAELLGAADGTEQNSLIEARNVAAGVVAPRLSLAQVQEWQRSPDSVVAFAKITNAIRDLSGLGAGADKSNLDSAGD